MSLKDKLSKKIRHIKNMAYIGFVNKLVMSDPEVDYAYCNSIDEDDFTEFYETYTRHSLRHVHTLKRLPFSKWPKYMKEQKQKQLDFFLGDDHDLLY